jgi:ribosomal protein L40E
MDIFNKVGETLSSKGKDVAKKAKDLAELASLRTQITVQENSINHLFQELGKMCYEQHKAGTEEDITEKCDEIDAAKAELERLKKALMTLKGVHKCPECGATVSESAHYCSKCGAALPVTDTEPEDEEEYRETDESEESEESQKSAVEIVVTVEKE